MEKYVTVVSVDDQVQQQQGASAPVEPDQPLDQRLDLHLELTQHRPMFEQVEPDQEDSQFVTVLSINHGEGRSPDDAPNTPEMVLVYRLPGERLGFGLKFQGGNRSNEKIQRLFIQSCAENSPASRVLASWGHLREGDEILEIDGVSVTRMTRIECVKCLKDSNVAIKLLVRNGEGRVQNFYPEAGHSMTAMSSGSRENVGEIPERKSGPPPPPPVPPRKLNKRKLTPVEPQSPEVAPKQPTPPTVVQEPPTAALPPPDAESYSNLFADDISDLISESDDTASTISTVVDKFSICSSLSSEDYTIPSNGPMGIGSSQSLELAKALKPFTLLEQEFNLESKFEPTNLFTFKPQAATPASNVVQLAVQGGDTEYENVSVMKVDENRNYENVTVPYGPYENVTIQTVQPYETMVLSRTANRRRISVEEPEPSPAHYENVDLKTSAVPPRPLPRQAAIVEPKKRAPIPVPIPIVVPPPRLKHTSAAGQSSIVVPESQPLGPEYNTVQNWLQDATEVIHECALVPAGGDVPVAEEKPKPDGAMDDLPRLIDFHPKVSVAPKEAVVAPPTSPRAMRYNGEQSDMQSVAPETIVRKCIKIIASEDHTYIESSSSDEDDEKMYCMGRSEDDDDRSSVLSRETTTTPEQFLSGDGYSDEDGEKLGPPEIVSGGPSEAYFNFPWSSNLLPPIGEVEEEFSSLEHQQHQQHQHQHQNRPIVIIDTADETVINDTNNNQQQRKKPIGDEAPQKLPKAVGPSANIVIGTGMTTMVATQGGEANDSEADQPDAGVTPVVDSSLTIDQDVGAPETDNLQSPPPQQQQQEVSDPEPPPAAAVDEDELVNNVHTADKPDQPVDNGGPSPPSGTTCQQDVSDMANDGVDGAVLVEQHPQHPPVAPALAESVGPIDSRSAMADRSPGPGDVPEATAALPDDADGGESERTAEGRKLQDDDDGEADSNIDAIVGDVDIVEGDTVESDFEELVKAQIEPVDVEDSSEQIQQIHERIIVGIERAVSEEVSEAAETVAPVPGEVANGDTDNEWSEVTPGQPDQPERDLGDVPVVARNSEVADKAEQDTAEQETVGIVAPSVGGVVGVATGTKSDNQSENQSASAIAGPPQKLTHNDDDGDGVDADHGHGASVASRGKSMDSMNNVVTTTTTVTAIASTVHQLVPATVTPAPQHPTAAASVAIGGKVAPPAFSRLPPDGHEFPPNFSEPSAINSSATPGGPPVSATGPAPAPPPGAAMTIMNGGGMTGAAPAKSNDKHSSFNDDLPDLPKSHPPTVPRKAALPPPKVNGTLEHPPGAQDSYRKPPPFPTRSSSIAESMLSRKDYQALQASTGGDLAQFRRRSVDVPEHPHSKPPAPPGGRVSLLGSNWRKDEKSERSVRDKIAMFSSAAAADGGEAPLLPAPAPGPGMMLGGGRKFSKDFTKSSENLLGGGAGSGPKRSSVVEAIETYATLRKKAHSVENLDEVDKASVMHGGSQRMLATEPTPKFSLETSKPVVLGKAYSVENLNPHQHPQPKKFGFEKAADVPDVGKVLARTISFSGYSNGGPPSSGSPGTGDERWKSSISSLLEQRKKSMSKLRGLVIPEKVPEAEVLADSRILGLPIIKSKDSEIILSSGVLPKDSSPVPLSYGRRTSTLPTPSKSSLNSLAKAPDSAILGPIPYKPRSNSLVPTDSKHSESEESESTPVSSFRKPLPPMPPAKPPRTSLVYPPPKGGSMDCLRSTEDESGDEADDSDSVLSSRVSSPPVSPVAPAAPVEKYALTRTLSSETNTSITSSNSSTLTTSSAGSQASCSSVGSTPPTVDLSRKLSKSSSSTSEATMNRKNVLASAKCRSGRGGELLKIGAGGAETDQKAKGRYEDGDSTDGYEEEERRKVSKSKTRGTNGGGTQNGKPGGDLPPAKELTHYKVVDAPTANSLVDKVIKVAAYVEVVSDLDDTASEVIEELVLPPKKEKPLAAPAPAPAPVPDKKSSRSQSVTGDAPMSDLAKWVRHEAARTTHNKEADAKVPSVPRFGATVAPVPVKRELRSSVETKKLNLAEIRKSFESKSANSTVIPAPVKQSTPPKEPQVQPPVAIVAVTAAAATATANGVTPKSQTASGHDRFSSWDSLASSSSGVSSLQTGAQNCSGSSQTLQSTPSDYGSFSSLGSSHSLMTPQDLQLIIEEADPPLATPDAFVVVLQRETPESSIGITLAGGSDYEAKEITIHKILTNSPAEKDGRLRKGDRILSINGLSMRGLTHRESLSVLKTPRPEVLMVITRSKSLVVAKLKRPSMGSLSSLAEKSELGQTELNLKIHKASRSLDLDHLDVASNEAESVFDGTTGSEDGLLSTDGGGGGGHSPSHSLARTVAPMAGELPDGSGRVVDVQKDGAGLGFSIEGGFDSPAGNKPLVIKKIFMGGAAEKSGVLRAGEEIVAINAVSIAQMTRIQVWNMMKKLPNGSVRLTLK